MVNLLISTGGSGGHVIPATILYEHLKKILIFLYLQMKEEFNFR